MTRATSAPGMPATAETPARLLRNALKMSDNDALAAMLAAHLAADPLEQLGRLWRGYAAESYQAGRADALAELAAIWPAYPKLSALDRPALAELEAIRWELRGEPRTRGTFADPHPDDRTGTDRA